MRMKVIKLLFHTENQTLNSKTTKETKTEHENIVWLFRKDYQRVSFHREKIASFYLVHQRGREKVEIGDKTRTSVCKNIHLHVYILVIQTYKKLNFVYNTYIERGWILF